MSTRYFELGRPKTGARLAVAAALLAAMAGPALAQSIHGTATYRERIALPPTAVFEATLEDVSRTDAPADVIARARLTPAGTTVAMMLRRAGSGPAAPPGSPTPSAPPQPRSPRPLEKTHWKATELDGKPVTAAGSTREVYILLGGTGRVGGSDGCNRIIGSYVLTGDGIKFGALAGTQMACPDTADTERGLRKALSGATRWSIVGDRLELLDSTGGRLAQFEALEGHDR
jgi:putative lipoprotein